MSIFMEKIEHACRVFAITLENVCAATKISPFSIYLHATEQHHLDRKEMLSLCKHFGVPLNYFTNAKIRFVDVDNLPDYIQTLIAQNEIEGIICYEVLDEDGPDITPEQLIDLLNLLHR